MARTMYPVRETTVCLTDGGVSAGNAVTDHSIVGLASFGFKFRTLIKFDLDFSGMTSITSAKLKVRVPTSTRHVLSGGSVRWRISRLAAAFSASGGNSHGSGSEFSSTANEDWDSQPGTTGTTLERSASISSPDHGDYVEFSITDIVRDWFDGSTNNGIRLWAEDEGATNDTMEFYSMRGSYEPRLVVEYESVGEYGIARFDAPTNGQVLEAAPSTIDFTFDPSVPPVSPITSYNLRIGTTPSGTDILNVTSQTSGISGLSVSRDVSALSFGTGVIYVTAWARNSEGALGTGGSMSFTIKAPPNTPTLISPTSAKPYAKVNNLGALAVWSGSEAQPQVQFTYSHPQGYAAVACEVNLGGVVTWYPISAASGSTVTVNVTTAMARATDTSIQVRVRAIGGQWSDWTTVFDCKVNWAQGLYAHTHASGASDFEFTPGALSGGAYTQFAAIFRKGDGTPGSWKATVGEVTPGTQMDVLVRLATGDSTQAPSLPDMVLSYNATPEPSPDNWTGANATIVVDNSIRRFGRRSMKVTPTGVGNGSVYARLNGAAIPVTPGVEYTLSMFVNTMGETLDEPVRLRATTAAGAVIADGVAPDGETDDTSSFIDGWQRLTLTFAPDESSILPALVWDAPPGFDFRVDSAQLEEGPRASQWRPGAAGQAVSLDVGGVQVDASLGGVVRLRGSTGGIRDVVTLGAKGLDFGDVEVYSDAADTLTINGDLMSGVFGPLAKAPIRRVYTSGATWTKPTGLVYAEVECIGPGGAGGGAPTTGSGQSSIGSGGGAGGYAKKLFAASALPASCTVTIGAGGTGVSGSDGNDGTAATTFAGSGITTVSAGPGTGGATNAATSGNGVAAAGSGGTCSGGDTDTPGGTGIRGIVSGGDRVSLGRGADGPYGAAGNGGSNTNGNAASGYGAGGGGASNGASQGTARTGGAGSGGLCIVTEYYAG